MWTNENQAKYDRGKRRCPGDPTDAEWACVAPLIPPVKRGGRKRPAGVREVVNADLPPI
jgi:hypothetical protein